MLLLLSGTNLFWTPLVTHKPYHSQIILQGQHPDNSDSLIMVTNEMPSNATREMTGAQFVVEALVQSGVTHVFGGHGGAVVGLIDAIVAHPKLEWVYCRCEVNASQAAAAYAKLHGGLGCCLATSGPGITHMLSGALDAHQDRVPMLVLSGLKDAHSVGHSDFQDVNQAAIFRMAGLNFSESVMNIQQLMPLVRNAISLAVQRCECAHLAIACDVALQSIPNAPVHFCRGNAVLQEALEYHAPKSDIEKFAEFLNKERFGVRHRMCICLGWRARGFGREVEALAEVLQVPIITRFDAKGAVDERHRWAYGVLGIYGNAGTRSAGDLLSQCDTVIGICMPDLDSLVAGKSGLQIRRWIQVETSLLQGDSLRYSPSFTFRSGAASLAQDLREVAQLLEAAVGVGASPKSAASSKPPGTPSTFLDGDCHHRADLESTEFSHPAVFFQALSASLSDTAVVCADIGDNSLWLGSSFVAKRGQVFLTSEHMGIMGYSLNAALASATARRAGEAGEHQTLVVAGDGGMQMSLNELATHRDHASSNTLVVVVVNRRLGRVQNEKWGASLHGDGCAIGSPDFVQLFAAYGYPGGLNLSSNEPEMVRSTIEQGWARAREHGMCVVVLQQDEQVAPIMHKLSRSVSLVQRMQFLNATLPADATPQPAESVAEGDSATPLWKCGADAQRRLQEYVNGLTAFEKSDPWWLAPGALQEEGFSPASILKSLVATLPSLPQGAAEGLFASGAEEGAFDLQWGKLVMSSFEGAVLAELLEQGRSKGFLLTFQLLAIPPGFATPLHAHASIEVVVGVVGSCLEFRCDHHIHTDRQDELAAGERLALSNKGPPSAEQLAELAGELRARTRFEDAGAEGEFKERVLCAAGQGVVNHAGSVHQPLAGREEGCIVLALYAGCHADIQQCNFHQSTGADMLDFSRV